MQVTLLMSRPGGGAMNLIFRGFSLDVLARMSESGGDPDEAAGAAVRTYLDDRTLRPPGWKCLPLPDGPPIEDGETALEVDLGEALTEEAGAEAAAQGVPLEALVTHAVMYAFVASADREPAQPKDGGARRRSTSSPRSERRSRTTPTERRHS
jgi:hypothetical protein